MAQTEITLNVDRKEGKFLVLTAEDGSHFDFPAHLLPAAQEGDFLTLRVDPAKKEDAAARVKKLSDSLFE